MRWAILPCSEVLYEIGASAPLPEPTGSPLCSLRAPSCVLGGPGACSQPPSLGHILTVLFVLAQNTEHRGKHTGVCLTSLLIPQTYTTAYSLCSTNFHPCWWQASSTEWACCVKLIKSWNVTEGWSLYLAPFLHARGLWYSGGWTNNPSGGRIRPRMSPSFCQPPSSSP